MTNWQLLKALQNHKYIVVRNWIGLTVAVNCRIALKLSIDKTPDVPMGKVSQVASFYPCSFQEYITKKIGYL